MTELVLVKASDEKHFAVLLDHHATPAKVLVRRGESVRLELALPAQINIAPDFVAPDGTRLKNLAEIRTLAAEKGNQLEEGWHQLIARLSRFDVKLEQNVGGVVLLQGVKLLSGVGSLTASFTVNLREHVTTLAALHASLDVRAECHVTLPDPIGPVSTKLGLSVDIDGEIPRLSFLVPELPFRLPPISWPDFDWGRLTCPTGPAIRLPSLPFLPVSITSDKIDFDEKIDAGGHLDLDLKIKGVRLEIGGTTKAWGNVDVRLTGGQLALVYEATFPALESGPWTTRLPGLLAALELDVAKAALHLQMKQPGGLMGWLDTEFAIRSFANPTKLVRVAAILPFVGDKLEKELTAVDGTVIKRSFRLVDAHEPLDSFAVPVPGGFAVALQFGKLDVPELKVLGQLLAEVLAAIGEALAGLARLVQRALESLASLLVDALSALDVTLVLESGTGHLRQILLSVRRAKKGETLTWEGMGLHVELPGDADIALLVDLQSGRNDAYVVVTTDTTATGDVATVSTDLWLGSASTERQAGELAPRPEKKSYLIQAKVALKAAATTRVSVVPLGIRAGRATFLHAVDNPLPPLGAGLSALFTGYALVPIAEQFEESITLDKNATDRLLPFLSAPSDKTPSSGGGVLDTLKQYIKIDGVGNFRREGDVFAGLIDVTIHAGESDLKTQLKLALDPRTLSARLSGGTIVITADTDGKFELLGMRGEFVDKSGALVTKDQLALDLSGSDPRLSLSKDVSLRLKFDKLSSAEKPLVFEVSKFVMHGGGLDLEAALVGEASIPLNGLGTDFRFKAARLSVGTGASQPSPCPPPASSRQRCWVTSTHAWT